MGLRSNEESAKKAEKSKESKVLKDTKPPPLPGYVTGKTSENHENKSITTELRSKKRELGLDEMLENIKRMQDEFDQKLEKVYQVTGWTPEYLSSYLGNPNNFNDKDWGWINQETKGLREKHQPKLDDLPEFVLKKVTVGSKAVKKAQGAKNTDFKSDEKMRKKTAGVRRKWIPMK